MLYSFYDAAAEYSLDPDLYALKPRETRAAMEGALLARRALASMQQWDMRPKPKKGKKV